MESILITGVGGGAGQGILKCLQGKYRLVGVDEFELATGLYAVDAGYLVPRAGQAGFIETLLDIAKKEGCRLIFPGLDGDLPALAAHREAFKAAGIDVVVSRPEVIDICDDKLATAEFLSSHGFPAPETRLFTDDLEGMPFPVVLKPRKGGARSEGVFVAKDRAELEAYRGSLTTDNYVIQEQIPGDEYTCGTVTFEGTCHSVILMRRRLRFGDTYKAFVKKNDELSAFVAKVAEALKPNGPCNFQLRLRDGVPYIFEFNGRCSGTTSSRALAGVNEPHLMAEYLLRGTIPEAEAKEMTILRYWAEFAVENDHIESLVRERHVTGSRGPL